MTTILSLLVVTYLASIPGRAPDIDDAWIGEHAYWLEKEGYVKSELMRGITGQEDYMIVSHKLLVLHGAASIGVFGFSVYSLKSIGLLYFLLFLVAFYYYTCRLRKIFTPGDLLFALILIFAFPWTFKYSFLFRPEIIIMLFAFVSFILLEKYLISAGKKTLILIPAGLVSGLAVAAHLNGLVVTGAGFLLLLLNRKWTGALLFGLASLFTTSIYFFDFNNQYSFAWWYYQISASPALDSINGIPFYLQPIVNLLKEHQRFFHNPMIIIFSIFLISALLAGGKRFWKEQRPMSLYTLLLFILTGLVAVHKSRQYILIYFPFLVIMITHVFSYLRNGQLKSFRVGNRQTVNVILHAFFFIFLAGSTWYNMQLLRDKFSPARHREITLEFLNGTATDKVNAIAPMTFIFNEIKHFNRIHGEVCYTEMQKANPGIYGQGFLEKADEYSIGFIYLTPYYRHKLGLDDFETGRRYNTWEVEENSRRGIFLVKDKI